MHVTGHPSTEYVSEETPMAAYANLHIAFEQMRVRALSTVHGSPNSDDDSEDHDDPPRVLVLGPENSGKTTVCKILINYAVRAGQDWSPLLANVDPSEVSFLFSYITSYFKPLEPSRVAGLVRVRSQPHQCIRLSQRAPLPIH